MKSGIEHLSDEEQRCIELAVRSFYEAHASSVGQYSPRVLELCYSQLDQRLWGPFRATLRQCNPKARANHEPLGV